MTIANGTCHATRAIEESPPLFQNGKIMIQAHHIGWAVCSLFTLIAIVISFWLINKHTRWYTNKLEQRHTIRILFMVPIYAVVSTASFFWWEHSTPLLLIRDCYESTVLTSFFYLLLLYISHDENAQKEVFRKNGPSKKNDRERLRQGKELQHWVYPLNFLKAKPADGLYFLQIMKWGILQYCVIRPGTTLAAVVLDYVGLYCEESWSLGWGHIWIVVVVSISVSIAMYCLIQLYMVVKVELAPQKPLLKLFAIKAVVFLTFWQATFLSLLTMFGIVKDTPTMTANDINIGIGAIAETTEMALFAVLHLWAFSYKPYYTGDNGGESTPRWRSLGHAMNFQETFVELWSGTVYMWYRYRGKEVDVQAHRQVALENVFGRSRYDISREANEPKVATGEKELNVSVMVEKEVRIGEEQQWLGLGDEYKYGLGYQSRRQRERSEGLESQIEKELSRRGYTLRGNPTTTYTPIINEEAAEAPITGHHHAQSSWWRRFYPRFSQSGPGPDSEASPQGSFPNSPRRSRHLSSFMPNVKEHTYEDPPPPSAIRMYRESKLNGGPRNSKQNSQPAFEPLLLASFGVPPGGPPDAHAQSRPTQSPSHYLRHPVLAPLESMASLSTPALPSPSMQSLQADSYLERAFAGSIDIGSSAEALLSGPSSQAHHAQIKFGGVPEVATRDKMVLKIPVLVDPSIMIASTPVSRSTTMQTITRPAAIAGPSSPVPPQPLAFRSQPPQSPPLAGSPPGRAPTSSRPSSDTQQWRRSSHKRDSAQFYPEPRALSPPQVVSPVMQSPPQSPGTQPRLSRSSAAYSRGTRRDSRGGVQYPTPPTMQYTPPSRPMSRYVPRRDQIVLPAPLAPQMLPVAAAESPAQEHTPARSRGSPPRAERRSPPYSPLFTNPPSKSSPSR
ncbi:DUF300-domain-containing protein [Epithele typhae]|uniref:DUF300-domain-containing protein n=1 Tax=Epithele typhae TaxID=378194 RepID=UPI0020082BD2|nr:DUF300-domain-containing protein [Epithele typhae]KAH9940896.1 DUF300-domain-containing protein [Epithele typhae]